MPLYNCSNCGEFTNMYGTGHAKPGFETGYFCKKKTDSPNPTQPSEQWSAVERVRECLTQITVIHGDWCPVPAGLPCSCGAIARKNGVLSAFNAVVGELEGLRAKRWCPKCQFEQYPHCSRCDR